MDVHGEPSLRRVNSLPSPPATVDCDPRPTRPGHNRSFSLNDVLHSNAQEVQSPFRSFSNYYSGPLAQDLQPFSESWLPTDSDQLSRKHPYSDSLEYKLSVGASTRELTALRLGMVDHSPSATLATYFWPGHNHSSIKDDLNPWQVEDLAHLLLEDDILAVMEDDQLNMLLGEMELQVTTHSVAISFQTSSAYSKTLWMQGVLTDLCPSVPALDDARIRADSSYLAIAIEAESLSDDQETGAILCNAWMLELLEVNIVQRLTFGSRLYLGLCKMGILTCRAGSSELTDLADEYWYKLARPETLRAFLEYPIRQPVLRTNGTRNAMTKYHLKELEAQSPELSNQNHLNQVSGLIGSVARVSALSKLKPQELATHEVQAYETGLHELEADMSAVRGRRIQDSGVYESEAHAIEPRWTQTFDVKSRVELEERDVQIGTARNQLTRAVSLQKQAAQRISTYPADQERMFQHTSDVHEPAFPISDAHASNMPNPNAQVMYAQYVGLQDAGMVEIDGDDREIQDTSTTAREVPGPKVIEAEVLAPQIREFHPQRLVPLLDLKQRHSDQGLRSPATDLQGVPEQQAEHLDGALAARYAAPLEAGIDCREAGAPVDLNSEVQIVKGVAAETSIPQASEQEQLGVELQIYTEQQEEVSTSPFQRSEVRLVSGQTAKVSSSLFPTPWALVIKVGDSSLQEADLLTTVTLEHDDRRSDITKSQLQSAQVQERHGSDPDLQGVEVQASALSGHDTVETIRQESGLQEAQALTTAAEVTTAQPVIKPPLWYEQYKFRTYNFQLDSGVPTQGCILRAAFLRTRRHRVHDKPPRADTQKVHLRCFDQICAFSRPFLVIRRQQDHLITIPIVSEETWLQKGKSARLQDRKRFPPQKFKIKANILQQDDKSVLKAFLDYSRPYTLSSDIPIRIIGILADPRQDCRELEIVREWIKKEFDLEADPNRACIQIDEHIHSSSVPVTPKERMSEKPLPLWTI